MVRCCLDMACLVCGWARRGKQETKTLCSSYWYTKSSLTVSSPGCAYLEEAIWLMPCKYSVKRSVLPSWRLAHLLGSARRKYLSGLCSEILRDRASLLIPVSVVGLSDPELEHDRTRHGRVVSAAVTPGVHCKQRQIVGVRLRILKSRGILSLTLQICNLARQFRNCPNVETRM
jgi:hypothetical protein